MTITGNLTVNGTTTTINSTTLTVNDKNVELAKVGSPTDTTASGAGITIKGATDKILQWTASATNGSSNTGYFSSTDNFNLGASGLAYYINGTSVLNATSLGSNVTGSSLTSVGTLSGGLNISTSQTYKVNSVDVLSASIVLGSAVTPTLGGNSTTGITLGGTALTSVQLGSNTTAANIITIGGAITGNTVKIASTAGGTVALSTDVTTGTVNLWASITTGTVNFANAITTGTINIAGGSGAAAVNIGNASGTTTVKGNLAVDSGKTFAIKGSSSGSVTFQAAATAGSVTYTLPSADAGGSGYALTSNGSGTLSWTNVGATISDITTNATYYPVLASSTTGSLTTASIASSGITFNPNTNNLIVAGTVNALITENSQSSSYTFALTDRDKVVSYNTSSSYTLTVPPSSSVTWPVGAVLYCQQLGTGTITLTAGAGVTLLRSGALVTNEEIKLRYKGSNTWSVIDSLPKQVNGSAYTGGATSAVGAYTVATFTSTGSGSYLIA
jgi:hypothetical protein